MAIIDSTISIDGTPVQVYVEGAREHKSMGQAFGKDADPRQRVIDRTEDVIGDGLNLATNCARRVIRALDEMDTGERPDTFSVSFGIRLSSPVGAVITTDRSTAQLQVTMSWKVPGSAKDA